MTLTEMYLMQYADNCSHPINAAKVFAKSEFFSHFTNSKNESQVFVFI